MDSLEIDKAILAGHSLAGVELTHFTERYPERVIELVYLDAVYDGQGRMEALKHHPLNEIRPPEEKHEFSSIEEYIGYIKDIRPDLAQIWNETWDAAASFDLVRNSDGKHIEKDTSSIGKQMTEGMVEYKPDHANIKVPVLSFVAVYEPLVPAYFTEEQNRTMLEFDRANWIPFQQKEMAKFKKEIPQAKIIEIPDSNHYCFMSNEDLVYDEMRDFLLQRTKETTL